MATGISDAALLRALAEDVPDMALTVREHLREIADHLESDRAANSLAAPADRAALLEGLLRETFELADNWPGIAYTTDLEKRINAALATPTVGAGAAESPEPRQPDGYAYEYPSMSGNVLRFNHGQEVNGSKPTRAVPYYLGTPAVDAGGQINDGQIKALFHKYGTGRLDGFTAAVRDAISGAVDAAPPQFNLATLAQIATARPDLIPAMQGVLRGDTPAAEAAVPSGPSVSGECPASVDGESGWVDVHERRPTHKQAVLIAYWPYNNRKNQQAIAHCIYDAEDGEFLIFEDGDKAHPPSHWAPAMPLPAAPNEPQP